MSWLRNATEFGIRLERYPDAQLVLFERLVEEPVAALNDLYARLGLATVDAGQLQRSLATIRYSTTNADEERGRSAKVSGIQSSALDRWRNQLTQEQLQSTCALTAAGADFYGYDLGSPDSVVRAVKALRMTKGVMIPKYLALYLYSRMRLSRLSRPRSGNLQGAVGDLA
jgi:hypothetical protein